MYLSDIVRRISTVAGSVVVLATGLAVLVEAFIVTAAPALPDGWQDNAFTIGGAVVTALMTAATAVRRLTEVPDHERGLLPSPGRDHVPPA
jgi:hypothetical protein